MAGGVSIGFTGYGSMNSRHHIGPELQIGHRLGDHLQAACAPDQNCLGREVHI
jgi:hypothetical protein